MIPTKKEINDMLLQLIEAGYVIGLRVDGEVKFIHIEHTDDEMIKNKLPIETIKKELDKYIQEG